MPADPTQLPQEIESKVPSERVDFTTHFANTLFEKATPQCLQDLKTEDLSAISLKALEFLNEQVVDKLVRVYNPDPASWGASYTIVEVAVLDRPFVVDTLRACVLREGFVLQHFLHPIFQLQRDDQGQLLHQLPEPGEGQSTAYELLMLNRVEEPERLAALEEALHRVLDDLILVTDDYTAMGDQADRIKQRLSRLGPQLQKLNTGAGPAELKEFSEFVEWLTHDNFVFLGYREYDIYQQDGEPVVEANPETGLGILRRIEMSSYSSPVRLEDMPTDIRLRLTSGPLLLVTKTNSESTVHRPARMDYIGIKKFDEEGRAAGEARFLGLFTSKALSTRVEEIPILRRKLKQVLALDDALEGSHDFKQIISVFNSIPREELFWSEPEELHRDIRTIMAIEVDRGVRVNIRTDPLARGLAVMVILPRDRFNTPVRRKIQDLLSQELQASHVDYHLAMGEDEYQIRLHFYFTTKIDYDQINLPGLDRRISELSRSWTDQLLEDLAGSVDSSEARQLAERYTEAFDDGYKAEIPTWQTVRDIANLERLKDEEFCVDLINPPKGRFLKPATHLKIYHRQSHLVLSEVFPILENLGVTVLEQISYRVRGETAFGSEGPHSLGIDIFRVVDSTQSCLDLESCGIGLQEAVLQLLHERASNDKLNHLILTAGFNVREIAWLETCRAYLAQVEATTSRAFITETLVRNPACAEAVYDYFLARFDPVAEDDREERIQEAADRFVEGLNTVSSLPEDETLRALFAMVAAVVRTNYFQGLPYISLKIDSSKVATMPEPRPLYEIVVSSRTMEGIHLRGGAVARGGLRWSDRPDDYRTEVLGLMKTQMTKNAVIVPVGSKGGFVVKHAPTDRDALREYVEEQYRTFIRGLLDLTDNLIDGKVVHPPNIIRYDGQDPYLVVAADKGTATFSDTANAISAEYNFWLGDAFASGGSHGYDHKKEGITARGAWECVARHFREIGINVRENEFTVAGIGDMSGDVFGNGMLYTDKIRLVAAFNHLHIFLDPNPDPRVSFQERQRLFNLPRSSWSDYNVDIISQGGGVFERHAKTIHLSPEIQQLLAVEESSLSGQAIVGRILRMKVDLLWNGGIGTYVKASTERNTDVGDPGNDALRIDATELRAQIVGEGGNLGLTQLARIEYSQAGGRINTDAIDNSAGVDMSDHEVNIKILLEPMVKRGELSLEDRNSLLKEMTNNVSELVLRNNYHQSLALSLAEVASAEELGVLRSLMSRLTHSEGLRPEVEFLPTGRQLEDRARNGLGFSRPELAILLAYTKMALTRHLLTGELPDESHLQHHLDEYFPKALCERFGDRLRSHPLRREIITCQLTNQLVDQLGLTFIFTMLTDSGAALAEVTRASLATMEILGFKEFASRILSLDNVVPAAEQYSALQRLRLAIEGIVQWILLGDANINNLSAFIERYREPMQTLRNRIEDLLPGRERRRFLTRSQRSTEVGFPPELANEITSLDYLPASMGLIDVAHRGEVTLEEAAKHFYAIGDRLALGVLRDSLSAMPKNNKWEKIASGGLVMDLRQVQRQLTLALLGSSPTGKEPSFNEFLARFPRTFSRYDEAIKEIRRQRTIDLTAVSVATRMLQRLVERSGPVS